MAPVTQTVAGFFKDARGVFNIFTVIALLAGLTVVGLPWIIVLRGYPNPERIDTLAYANFFLVLAASVGDVLLSSIMEHGFWKARKAPDLLIDSDKTEVKSEKTTVNPDPDQLEA
ncbi:hypothetical protein [Hymenobacter koreensis]|uniref:Uncharacterized protein n=1 Tax=Hymenobacter koreensis TaxID=1084523 RepID=A0ABP8JK08_9BACT